MAQSISLPSSILKREEYFLFFYNRFHHTLSPGPNKIFKMALR